MPDIQMLPDLSVIFGVTIDELFELTDETHLERIKNMIYNQRFISKDDYNNAEKFLLEKLKDEKKRPQCLSLLAELHIHRSNEHRELASLYAKEAFAMDPYKKATHNALRDAEQGAIFDWNFSNRHKLIEYYKNFISEHRDLPSAVRK